MALYRSKVLTEISEPWRQVGDHPKVILIKPGMLPRGHCAECNLDNAIHGILPNSNPNKPARLVCPGDRIGEKNGSLWVIKSENFERWWEPVT